MANWFKGANPLTRETRSLYVARPENRLRDLIYKHTDRSIPRGAKLTVRDGECALFFREGRLVGRLGAGTIQLDTANIPFLGHLVVDKLTDANHFLCELFFVSLNETTISLQPRLFGQLGEIKENIPVGEFRDIASGIIVSIYLLSFSYTIAIVNPEKLVTNVTGQGINLADKRDDSAIQNRDAMQDLKDRFNGRLLNQLRQVVGREAQKRGVMEIVSNVDAEKFSEQIKNDRKEEFNDLGIRIGRIFDLALSLDSDSSKRLQKFGEAESNLAIQARGANLATQEGFAQFNFVQGQREMMQGLGKGLGTGNAPMIMTGMNTGGAFSPPAAGGPVRPLAPRPPSGGGAILSSPAGFLMVEDAGERGPYTARQVALMAISKGQALSQVVLRRTDDPPDVTFTADLEPQVVAEFQRRTPPGA